MSEALSYLLSIYRKFIIFVFDEMEIESGITFGWVMVVGIIFLILIRNILALPDKSSAMRHKKRSVNVRSSDNGN